MKRAVIYCRISEDATQEGLGVQRQEQDARTLCQQRGYDVAAVYVDNDLSASTISKKVRPEYQRMLASAQAGEVDVIVAYSNSRLTRRPAEWIDLINLANAGKVGIATVASGQHDLSTADGRAVAITIAAWDAAEAERTGERVARAAKQRAEKGIPQKGRHRLFGYTRDWQVYPEEADIVVEVFERRAKGESTTAIAKDLTKRGITTVAGNEWKSGTLGVTLTKPVYCGLREYRGEIIGPSAVPALVDKTLFDGAQKELANDKKGTNTRKYLLSGILLCAHCLSPMKGNPSNHMYRCSTTYGGCGRLSVRIQMADDYVFQAAMSRYASTVGNAKEGGPVRDYATEAKAAQDEIDKLQNDYRAEVYTLAEVQPLIRAKRAEVKELEKQAAKTRTSMPKIQRRYLDWYKMTLDQKRVFIGDHIRNVVVHPATGRGNPDRLECHYLDGTKERLEKYEDIGPLDDE